MKLNHIRDVIAVADIGSLRAASRQLGRAQPAMSRSIKDIEEELGASLFERNATGVRLTPIGEAFVERARCIASEMQRVRDIVEQMKGGDTGTVTAVFSTAISVSLIQTVVPLFRKRYPNGVLKLSESLFPPIARELEDGLLDFYVGGLDDALINPRFLVEKLWDNQRVVAARRGHPLLDAKSVDELASAEWLRGALLAGTAVADFEDIVSNLGLPPPKIVMQTGSAIQMLVTITSSDLLTVLPRQWLEIPLIAEHIEALSVVGFIAAAPICLARRSGAILTPMAERFCSVVRRTALRYASEHRI